MFSLLGVGGICHTSRAFTWWPHSLVKITDHVGLPQDTLPFSSLNLFLPLHTSLNFHFLSLPPYNQSRGRVVECLYYEYEHLYSELAWDKDQEGQIAEMVKCLRLVKGSQGAGSQELNLLVTWFTSGPCKNY